MITKKIINTYSYSISRSKLNICLEYIYHKIKKNITITCFDVDKHKIRFDYIVYVDFHVVIEIKLFLNFKTVGIGKSNF